MSIYADSITKFRDIFEELHGLELTVEELSLSAHSRKWLARADIVNLQQILSMSGDEFMKIGSRIYAEVFGKLQELTKSRGADRK